MTVPRRLGGPAGHRVERSNAGCSHAAGWRLRAARCDAACARRAGDRACRWATATGPSRPSRRPSWHLSHVHHSPLSRTAGPPDRLAVQRALTVDTQILGGRDLDSIYTVTVLESLDYPDTNRQPICSHSIPTGLPYSSRTSDTRWAVPSLATRSATGGASSTLPFPGNVDGSNNLPYTKNTTRPLRHRPHQNRTATTTNSNARPTPVLGGRGWTASGRPWLGRHRPKVVGP